MNEAYKQGFEDMCKQAGVNPEKLIKLSQQPFIQGGPGQLGDPGPSKVNAVANKIKSPFIRSTVGGIAANIENRVEDAKLPLPAATKNKLDMVNTATIPSAITDKYGPRSKEAYAKGFEDSCKQAGVNPEELIKQAQYGWKETGKNLLTSANKVYGKPIKNIGKSIIDFARMYGKNTLEMFSPTSAGAKNIK
ncbi:hypothetical protein ACFLQL_02290 [Verrucomicrobiota bacterium]